MNKFHLRIANELDAIYPNLSNVLDTVCLENPTVAEKALLLLVDFGCHSIHVGYVFAARKLMAAFDNNWLYSNAIPVAMTCLSVDDAYGVRLFFDHLYEIDKSLIRPFADICLRSTDAEVIEAANDFLEYLDDWESINASP